LFVVKELGLAYVAAPMLAVAPLRFAAVKSFCLSAAEKRDYEASFLSRQLLFAEFFRFAWLQLPRLASQSRPSQSTCFTTFTASSSSSCFASCAALLNGSRTIASLSKPWQGFLEKYFIDHFGNDETAQENAQAKNMGPLTRPQGLES